MTPMLPPPGSIEDAILELGEACAELDAAKAAEAEALAVLADKRALKAAAQDRKARVLATLEERVMAARA